MLEQLVWPGLGSQSAAHGSRPADTLWMLSMWPLLARSLSRALRQEERPQLELVPKAISIAREMLRFALEASTVSRGGAAAEAAHSAAGRAEACCTEWNDLYCAMDE